MRQGRFEIVSNSPLAAGVYRLVMAGDDPAFTAPGQFLDIALPGYFLRRPISVCDWDAETVTVLYKVMGKGTEALSALEPGVRLDVLTGLGNGFDAAGSGRRPLLVGGGIGAAPLYRLMKELLARGEEPVAILGYNSVSDLFYTEEFAALGGEVIVTTADGSRGIRGFVTDGVREAGAYSCVYACGPTPMLRALDGVIAGPAQYSFEERMGCGFGACMGCAIRTKSGMKRVCRDGPVFAREEVLW
ncbi:MAG: dihydroorotate dehydrogenase electron transfer subunit [Oscillospiraceae bacterium]|nr:dihydroorotate dehydrogenase electron transfer subunit [Oscillospiraceae bacterium]